MRRYFTKYVRNKLFERIKEAREKRIVIDDKLFSVDVSLVHDDSILVLKKFMNISDEIIIEVLANIAKREELLFEVNEYEAIGEKVILFSIRMDGKR